MLQLNHSKLICKLRSYVLLIPAELNSFSAAYAFSSWFISNSQRCEPDMKSKPKDEETIKGQNPIQLKSRGKKKTNQKIQWMNHQITIKVRDRGIGMKGEFCCYIKTQDLFPYFP